MWQYVIESVSTQFCTYVCVWADNEFVRHCDFGKRLTLIIIIVMCGQNTYHFFCIEHIHSSRRFAETKSKNNNNNELKVKINVLQIFYGLFVSTAFLLKYLFNHHIYEQLQKIIFVSIFFFRRKNQVALNTFLLFLLIFHHFKQIFTQIILFQLNYSAQSQIEMF